MLSVLHCPKLQYCGHMATVTGKSPGAVEACQKVPKGPKKTAPNTKKNSNSVTAEQLSRLPVEKSLDKHYVPDVFTGQHVTELVAENAALKNKVHLICIAYFFFNFVFFWKIDLEKRHFAFTNLITS